MTIYISRGIYKLTCTSIYRYVGKSCYVSIRCTHPSMRCRGDPRQRPPLHPHGGGLRYLINPSGAAGLDRAGAMRKRLRMHSPCIKKTRPAGERSRIMRCRRGWRALDGKRVGIRARTRKLLRKNTHIDDLPYKEIINWPVLQKRKKNTHIDDLQIFFF